MRKIVGFLALSLFIFSCTESATQISETPKNRPTGADLAIEWGVITNNYAGGYLFSSELAITNNSEHTLENKGWTMYFSFNACRPINQDSLPKTVKIDHINGDFFKLTPTETFPLIKKGEKFVLPIVSSPWAIKNTDVPGGFYFVFNDSEKAEPSEFTLAPGYTTPEQINKTKDDKNIIPTAQTRFDANKSVSLIPANEVQKIIPTPVVFAQSEEELTITSEVVIKHGEGLNKEADYLANALKQNLGAKPSISSDVATSNSITLAIGEVSINDIMKNPGDEAYTLDITKDGITITGSDKAGVFYGIQSLRALLPVATFTSAQKEITLTATHVEDYPGLTYRGMHLDVARNFQSKESVLKLLDMMAFYKLNIFHFHFIDDEGWRLEIEELPELTEVGSKRGHTLDESENLIPSYGSGGVVEGSNGTGHYTRAEFIEILKYATERHIEVIPELDMPGHARAAIKSMNARYNKYIANGDTAKATEYLLADLDDKSEYKSVQIFTDNVVCVCQSSTYKFLQTVLDDVVEMYQEAGAPITTIHTGGDEVPHGVWEKSPVCDEFMANNEEINDVKDLKGYFLSTFNNMIVEKGLKTAGWEEIGMHLEMVDGKEAKTINPEFVDQGFQTYSWNSVYGWGGEEVGYKLANAGYKTVLSNVTNLYFDLAYDKDPAEPGFYWGGFVTTETAYSFLPYDVYSSIPCDLNGNPIPKDALADKEPLSEVGRANIQGIQGQLWTETVLSSERMDYMIYPRLIALAERAWTPTPSWQGQGEEAYAIAWNGFANAMGQREMPRMDHLFRGVLYRVPMPGAVIEEGNLMANITFPGLTIRYTTDGTEPTPESAVYTESVTVTGEVKLKAFTPSGRASRTLSVK